MARFSRLRCSGWPDRSRERNSHWASEKRFDRVEAASSVVWKACQACRVSMGASAKMAAILGMAVFWRTIRRSIEPRPAALK
ncbi:hypothetical protein D3C85_1429250 [compost metagenome]